MTAPSVDQLGALADLFEEALQFSRPESVIVLGVAGGNGLERVDPQITSRIDGVDLHPEYLAACQDRYGHLPSLRLHQADLTAAPPPLTRAALVHAALIFEHAGLQPCLDTALRWVAPGGYLGTVLQLPSESADGVAPTGVASLQGLRDRFRLIAPQELEAEARAHGFGLVHQRRRAVASGKGLWMGLFARGVS